jgi:hypothetical protein
VDSQRYREGLTALTLQLARGFEVASTSILPLSTVEQPKTAVMSYLRAVRGRSTSVDFEASEGGVDATICLSTSPRLEHVLHRHCLVTFAKRTNTIMYTVVNEYWLRSFHSDRVQNVIAVIEAACEADGAADGDAIAVAA